MPARACRSGLLHLLYALAALALAAPGVARAEDEGAEDVPGRVERPNALRAGALVQTGGIFDGPLWYGTWVFTYSRQLAAPLALELSGGPGAGGGKPGPHVGAGARLSLTRHGISAFTVGLASRVAFLDGYGPVAFGDAELAWELRSRFGLSALVGGGLGMTLTTSRRRPTACEHPGSRYWCHDDRFEGGDSGLFLHGELGWAF